MPEKQTSGINHEASSQLSEAFLGAEDAIYGITESPDFAQACLESGLDPLKSSHDQAYWSLVASFATDEVSKRREAGDNSMEVTAYELLALSPAAMFAESTLTKRQASGYQEAQQLKQMASYYNSLLRYFGSAFPDITVSETQQAIENVCSMAGLDDAAATAQVRHTVRGAQHELGFGQLLHHTGRTYEAAPLELDLQGTDYVVDVDGDQLRVDVKASLSEVEALGSASGPFAIRWPRHKGQEATIVMYSLVQDAEFHDRFLVSDEIAEARAPVLNQLLTQAKTMRDAA